MIPQPVAPPATFPFPEPLPHLHIENEICPWCEQKIPPDKFEEISGKIAKRERQQTQAITARLEQQYAIEKAHAAAKAQADLELERRQSAARETAASDQARKAAEAAAAEKLTAAEQKGLDLQEQLDDLRRNKDAEIAKMKEVAAAEALRISKQAAEAEDKLAKLSEQHELRLKQQLDSQREILEKAKDDAVNAERARAFDETQKMSNKVADLQRALENRTAEELGEGAEIDLFEALKKQFPDDRIERIAKGSPGADIRHVVLHSGRECGTIIYDSKNHKAFRNDHVTKLVQDQMAAKAEHAILSTHKFPQGARQLHMQDGVLLANPARVVAVVTLIRQHMVQTHMLRLSNTEREHKTAALYDFIVSDRCTQFFSRIDANAHGLLDLQVKEKKFHDTAWKKEGELIRQIQKTQADLSSEITRIIGTAVDDELEIQETGL